VRASAVKRIALGLEYDGTGFAGWQTQKDGSGIQDVVEAALRSFIGQPVQTVSAGRTDAGVHATGQVVHLDSPVQREAGAWVRGVNRFLPRTIAIRWAREVPDRFHARFSAVGRTYEYWILNDPVRSALHDQRAAWVFRPLDVAAMQAAATVLLGTHDFSSFRSAECQAASPVRELRRLEIERLGRLVRVQAAANAFLHHMVRNLVGTLVYIGVGRRPPQWAGEVLAMRDRAAAAPTFAACGLYLTRVEYDRALELPNGADEEMACTPWRGRGSRSAD
jgi:tRNA pseudouridine38-40 synthase